MASEHKPELVDSGAEIIAQHLKECTATKAAVVVDGSADDLIALMTAEGWVLDERVDRIAGKRIRFLTVPYQRPCCDHCNNREGDPDGHDYVPGGSVHDGPCEQCAAERARRRARRGDRLMEDLDRAYVINGDDLRIALADMNGRWPAVPNPRTMAGDIIDAIAEPLDGHRALIGRARLAEQLDGFYLTVMPDSGPAVNGQVDDPAAVAALVFKEHAAAVRRGDRPESDEDVVDAHICCDHAGDAPGPFSDAEVAAMAALVPALPLVSKLGADARERVLDWARRRVCDSLSPF